MSGMMLEWAFSGSRLDCPYSWQALDRDIDAVDHMEEIPCWGILGFSLLLPGEEGFERVSCHIEKQLPDDIWLFKIWRVEVTDAHGNFVAVAAGGEAVHDGVYLRKIPCCAIFNCSFGIISDVRFSAVFTTIAGNEALRVEQPLPPVLKMRLLYNLLSEAALAYGLLRSQNQNLAILLNGSAQPVSDTAVLWDREAARSSLPQLMTRK